MVLTVLLLLTELTSIEYTRRGLKLSRQIRALRSLVCYSVTLLTHDRTERDATLQVIGKSETDVKTSESSFDGTSSVFQAQCSHQRRDDQEKGT